MGKVGLYGTGGTNWPSEGPGANLPLPKASDSVQRIINDARPSDVKLEALRVNGQLQNNIYMLMPQQHASDIIRLINVLQNHPKINNDPQVETIQTNLKEAMTSAKNIFNAAIGNNEAFKNYTPTEQKNLYNKWSEDINIALKKLPEWQ